MKRFILLAAVLALAASCGDKGSGPIGVSDNGTFMGLPLPSEGERPAPYMAVRKLEDKDIDALIAKGLLKAEDLKMEGGICPVLMDCWWVDSQEVEMDLLNENYMASAPPNFYYAVGFVKYDPAGYPMCGFGPFAPTYRIGVTRQCIEGKPRIPLPLEALFLAEYGPLTLTKGLWLFIIGIPYGPGTVYHDSFWVADWDDAGILYDDACGTDVWGPQSGDGAPLRFLMIFGPEPPWPPGGFPPGRLPGEDGETRPWCFAGTLMG